TGRHSVARTGIELTRFGAVFGITTGQKWVTKQVRVPLLTLNDEGLARENGSGLLHVQGLGTLGP
ncbi:hypothetical protein, partial [Streptomyces sp. Wh19]|uniref:hypothetical protein n=1 Tax=Streptomyces sp. Wh19 TaxID=3076629 RepID=UPI0029587A2B